MANAYGRAKAERFRRRFGLSLVGFDSLDPEYANAHDYIHTVLGLLPGPWDDEWAVLQFEESIRAGTVPMPRGLDVQA